MSLKSARPFLRLALAFAMPGAFVGVQAQDPTPRERDLEGRVQQLETKLGAVMAEMADRREAGRAAPGQLVDSWHSRFNLGGYGESHANFVQASDEDYLDNHRFVLYLGYEFADWIQLHSETEIEHSLVEDDNGELSLEQLHTDILLDPRFNIRLGRFLVPVGITNEKHEPTTFFSVERPAMEQVLIPTTWSQDGIGMFGRFGDQVEYQAYIGSGLDGSGFTALNGIRGGRLQERPGINEPGVTGRVNYRPSFGDPAQQLRLGVSAFASGLDNGNQGTSAAPGSIQVYAADLQYRRGAAELRAVYVHESIDDADELNAAFGNDVAERLQGFYVEAAYHWWPEEMKTGKLGAADAVVFARLEDYDTQDRLPANAVRNPNAERKEVCAGLAFFLTSQFVLKADYRYRNEQPDQWNLGVGWMF